MRLHRVTSLDGYAKGETELATAQALANLRMLRMRWSAGRFEHDQRSLWQAHVNVPKCRSGWLTPTRSPTARLPRSGARRR
ncbi:hypothetical protein MESS2_1000026 [Mesorhizobium metallidurans STM 2683]|uniref:Uncharacterized protein n=1 Tax=Mesorhizobium metallidurans STM 2683 TaxID=1297569 RepID=M5EFA4_9HYPH|nr:hypothetical protein MESS2_1000026 [Mesorhizobium metallidurans STM 2683]